MGLGMGLVIIGVDGVARYDDFSSVPATCTGTLWIGALAAAGLGGCGGGISATVSTSCCGGLIPE